MQCEVDYLRKAADLLEPEGAWCKGSYVNTSGAHCAIGALRFLRDADEELEPCYGRALNALSDYIHDNQLAERWRDVISWNDSDKTGQEDVVRVFRAAADRLEGL